MEGIVSSLLQIYTTLTFQRKIHFYCLVERFIKLIVWMNLHEHYGVCTRTQQVKVTWSCTKVISAKQVKAKING